MVHVSVGMVQQLPHVLLSALGSGELDGRTTEHPLIFRGPRKQPAVV